MVLKMNMDYSCWKFSRLCVNPSSTIQHLYNNEPSLNKRKHNSDYLHEACQSHVNVHVETIKHAVSLQSVCSSDKVDPTVCYSTL